MASACVSALIGLSTLNALAQNCNPGVGGNLGLSGPYPVPNDVYVHVGQPLTITSVNVQNPGTCTLTNLRCWVVYPDNTFQMFVDMGTTQFAPGGNFTCNGAAAGNCLPFTTSYVVKPSDVNNTLSFTTNWPPGQNTVLVSGSFGIDNVQVMFAEAAGAIRMGGGVARGSPGAGLIVLQPCVNVTKFCPPCTPYGQPITFSGTVSNCTANNHADPADSRLLNVVVTDNHPGAIITFSTTTRLGNPFPANGGGTLLVNDSVNFTGSYVPPNTGGSSLCGPFNDTVTVTAADRTGFTVTNTASARCPVQTRPAIDLTKDCGPVDPPCLPGNPRSVRPGRPYTETFTVRNTGDVPLRNVRVNDSVAGVIQVTGSASCPQLELAPGASCTVTITRTAPTDSCAPITDRAVAMGDQICPPEPNCPSPATVLSAERTCTLVVCCPPRICIEKLVTCKNPGVACENATGYAKTAVGFRTDTQNPAFCYRVTITNCGPVDLTNVMVFDNHLGDLTPGFFASPGIVFPVGGSATRFFTMAWPADTTNTVTVTGQSVIDGSGTTNRDSAVVQVVVASIQCVKLVTSPADLDGNPNDNHVTVPADGNDHPVTYQVRISAGSAALSNVTIGDPMLAALGCALPGPFSLAANATTSIDLCTVTRNCLSSTNDCANPQLGAAAGCTVLQLDSSKVDMTGPPGGVIGDVCIGPGGRLSMSGSQYITGQVRLAPGATFSRSGATTVGGVLTNVDLSAEINAAYATAARLATQSCTQTFGTLNRSTTILGNGGTNVICVQNVDLNGGAVVTLQGTASDVFIVNVTGKFKLSGGSKIVAAGGVPNRNILYNVIGTGEAVAFSGGGGGVNCCASSVDGTLLAPQRKIALSPGLVNGAVISAMDISIVSGASVRCPPGLLPPPLVNTLTVTAQVDALSAQGCAYDTNGAPIHVGCSSSATVECSGSNAAQAQVALRMIDHVCQLSCATEAGKPYKVQYTDSLSTPEWQDLADFVGTGSIVILNDSGGGPQRFYRLVVVQ